MAPRSKPDAGSSRSTRPRAWRHGARRRGDSWRAPHVVVAAGSWTDEIRLPETPAAAVRPVGVSCSVSPGMRRRCRTWSGERTATSCRGRTERCWSARRWRKWGSTSGRRRPACAICSRRCVSSCPRRWGATFLDARAGLRPATRRRPAVIGRRSTVPRAPLRDRPLPQRHPAGAADGVARRAI